MSIGGFLDLTDAAAPALVGMWLAAAAAAIPALLVAATVRRRPEIRHAAGLAALAAALLGPALAHWAPTLPAAARPPEAPVAPASPTESADRPAPAPAPAPDRVAVASGVASTPAGPTDRRPSRPRVVEPAATPGAAIVTTSWARPAWAAVVVAWLAGSLLLAFRLTLGLVRIARMRREAAPFFDPEVLPRVAEALGIASDRLPPIATADDVTQPMAIGAVRPMVLLPASLPGRLSADALRDVLVHECAHALRRDPLVGLLQRVATALHWPSPLMHLLNWAIESAREDLCDNHALRAARPADYATSLLAVAELRPGRGPDPLLAPPILARRERLEARVARIVDPRRPRRTRAPRLFAATALAASVGAGVTAATLVREGSKPAAPVAPGWTRFEGEVVDEAGRPQPGAVISAWRINESFGPRSEARADARGRFVIDVNDRDGALLQASNDDRTRLSQWEIRGPASRNPEHRETFARLILMPAVETLVHVADAEGRPVAGATIPAHFGASWETLRTDDQGEARIRDFNEGHCLELTSYKSGVGLDYHSAGGPRHDRIDLTLNGSLTARVRAVDTARRPVPGVKVRVIYVGKVDRPSTASMAFHGVQATTDADGLATFDFLPIDLAGIAPFDVLRPYNLRRRPAFDPRRADEIVEIVIDRLTPVTGRVFGPNDEPVAGVIVRATSAEGSDVLIAPGGTDRTAADGSYRLDLAANRGYSIGVDHDALAAVTRFGVIVREGKPVRHVDFHLEPGAVVRGRAINPDGSPASRTTVSLIDVPPRLPGAERPEFPNDERRDVRFLRLTRPDSEGRYRFQVPAGSYLMPGAQTPFDESVEVVEKEEVVRDYHLPANVMRDVSLKVRRTGPDAAAVPDVRLMVAQRGGSYSFLLGITDGGGNVRGSYGDHPARHELDLYARSADGSLAGFGIMGPDDVEGTVLVEPATTVRGRVVLDHGAPVPAAGVSADLSRKLGGRDVVAHVEVACDREGRFVIPAVPAGTLVKLSTATTGRSTDATTEFVVNDLTPVTAPDLSIAGIPEAF